MVCQICGESRFKVVSQIDAKSRAPLTVSLCGRCGLVQQTPMPTDAELRAFYSTQYRLEYKGVTRPKPKHIVRAGRLAIDRIRFLQRHAGMAPRSLLDIGAGGGEFVYLYGRKGLGTARGIEPNEGYCQHAREHLGVDVEPVDLRDADGTHGIITLFHVLEHLVDLQDVFRRLHGLLEPGGILFIEVPCVDTPAQSPNTTYFRAHTLYFSDVSLQAAASTHFEGVVTDSSSGCLRAIFRRRDTVADAALPDPALVRQLEDRIRRRTWLRHLIRGGAARPFRKMIRNLQEVRDARDSARLTLERLAGTV